jgi:undecaprenyl-diphosphatase
MLQISDLDWQLFILINHLPHTPFSDWAALAVSGIGAYGIVWMVIAAALFIVKERRHPLYFLPIASAIVASYIASAFILKPFFGRLRPDPSLGALIVDIVNHGYSFPSVHAALAFTGAVVISTYERKLSVLGYILATLIALSRIYLGKHYPSDVIGGAILGYCIGRLLIHHHSEILKEHVHSRTKKHK